MSFVDKCRKERNKILSCHRSTSGLAAKHTPIATSEVQSKDQRVEAEVRDTIELGIHLGFQMEGFEEAIRKQIAGNKEQASVAQ